MRDNGGIFISPFAIDGDDEMILQVNDDGQLEEKSTKDMKGVHTKYNSQSHLRFTQSIIL